MLYISKNDQTIRNDFLADAFTGGSVSTSFGMNEDCRLSGTAFRCTSASEYRVYRDTARARRADTEKMKSHIAYLYECNQIENECMWDGIHRLSNEQWLEARDYSRGSIHDHIVHVMYATTRWTYALKEMGKMPPLVPAKFPEIQPAHQRWQQLWGEINAYVLDLSENELGERTHWALPRIGLNGQAPLWQLLHHLSNHALDHRVQVLMILERYYGINTAFLPDHHSI